MTVPDTQPAETIQASRLIRLGVHGSPRLATDIIIGAGHSPDGVRFVGYDVREPFRPLRRRVVDIMIVKYALREADISFSRPVAFDPRAVIVGAGHPLAGREAVSLEEVARYGAFRCPGDFPGYVWDRIVPPRTASGTPIVRVHPMTTVEAMVGILTTTHAVHISFASFGAVLPSTVRAIPVHDLPPAPVAFAWLRSAPLPVGAAALVADAERRAS